MTIQEADDGDADDKGEEIPELKRVKPAADRLKVADEIIWIFGIAILGTLALNFLLLAGLIFVYKSQPDRIEIVVTKAVVPLLTTTGTFASTLFGPLLAFILGYYFSQKHDEQQAKPKAKPKDD